jgi:hypothetical protein
VAGQAFLPDNALTQPAFANHGQISKKESKNLLNPKLLLEVWRQEASLYGFPTFR